jgi:hypothetical protein
MSTNFGYMNAWAKKGFKTLIEEDVQLADELMLSGQVKLTPEMAQQLIEYLQDPANCGQYGIQLDFALFYKDDAKVAISGKLTTPYVKGETTNQAPASSRARRTV